MPNPESPFDLLPRNCWVTVDRARLTENMRCLRAAAGVKSMAVIKANGYGHGYENAAHAFLAGGADYLGTATLSEGLLLRQMGITAPVLVMGALLPPEIVQAAQVGLEFFVWRQDHLQALREMPKTSAPAHAHLKIDTGMGRAGCEPSEAVELARALRAIAGVELAGLCTHFASADIPDRGDTERQVGKFDRAITALTAAGMRPSLVHAANSPGALYFPKARYDMVRFGIVAYGIPPDEGLEIPGGVQPALSWRALITSTKILPAGHGVSYGGEFVTPKPMRIGILGVGYADGFRRTPKSANTVLVAGQERKVLGRVCMDQCMIDLDGFDDITGAEAVLIGEQRGKTISVIDLAKRWGTNTHEVCTSISMRVPRRAEG